MSGRIFLLLLTFLCGDVVAQKANGNAAKAVHVATAAFLAKLDSKPKDWQYGEYVSRIENYSIGVAENKASYVVVFRLRRPRDTMIFGGDADYFIDKNSFVVTRFVGYK